jgi:hypothetical protein
VLRTVPGNAKSGVGYDLLLTRADYEGNAD